jgi:hypothetical protein
VKSSDFINHLLLFWEALFMGEKTPRWFLLPFLGGLSFWLPDTVTHLIRSVQFDRRDVMVVTVLMPLCLCAAGVAASKILKRSLVAIAPQLLLGIWVTGGLLMSLGWMLSTRSPLHSLAVSSVLGIIPIYTFMAAAYDGSLAALLLVSIVLFVAWILPMGFAKRERKAH